MSTSTAIILFAIFLAIKVIVINQRKECFITSMIVCIILCEICVIASALLTLKIAKVNTAIHPNLYQIETYFSAFGFIFLSMFYWIFALQYLQTSYIFPLLLGNVELKLDIDEMNETLCPENQFQVKKVSNKEIISQTLASKVYQ